MDALPAHLRRNYPFLTSLTVAAICGVLWFLTGVLGWTVPSGRSGRRSPLTAEEAPFLLIMTGIALVAAVVVAVRAARLLSSLRVHGVPVTGTIRKIHVHDDRWIIEVDYHVSGTLRRNPFTIPVLDERPRLRKGDTVELLVDARNPARAIVREEGSREPA